MDSMQSDVEATSILATEAFQPKWTAQSDFSSTLNWPNAPTELLFPSVVELVPSQPLSHLKLPLRRPILSVETTSYPMDFMALVATPSSTPATVVSRKE
jgi:hypothetical protein